MPKTFRDLDIYQESFKLFIEVHRFTLDLPKYELYELGSQLRRSADSINSNIVEGYGRKRYTNDFIRFLIYAHASNHETIGHLEKLKVLYPNHKFEISKFLEAYFDLGGKIYRFIEFIQKNWRSTNPQSQ